MSGAVELLAPAGDLSCLCTALRFGADAVYVGGPMLQLRAGRTGFSLRELEEAVSLTHSRGRKLYVAVNAFPSDVDIAALRTYGKQLEVLGVDAAIVSDLGAIVTLRECAPELTLHLSTQANCLNAAAARVYRQLGVQRIVLARELSIERIRALRQEAPPELELEAFVHGAMCMAYSGRCLISSYLTGRSANRGACTQPCRWNYHLMEETRPGEYFPIEEEEQGTSLLSSFDLNCLDILDQLQEAGISSFKLEGRMKTAYYVGTVVNAYRRRLDALRDGTANSSQLEALQRELNCVSHRPYASGFYLGDMRRHAPAEGPYLQDALYIGSVCAATEGWIEVELNNRVQLGERLEVVSPHSLGNGFPVSRIRNLAGDELECADVPGEHYRFACTCPVDEGDFLRKPLA